MIDWFVCTIYTPTSLSPKLPGGLDLEFGNLSRGGFTVRECFSGTNGGSGLVLEIDNKIYSN